METPYAAPALPLHSQPQALENTLPAPIAAFGMISLMALLWLVTWLVLTPVVQGRMIGTPIEAYRYERFSPLSVSTHLPRLLVADDNPTQSAHPQAQEESWELARSHATHVAGALVEDEVQGVLLKLQLVAETGKLVGRMVKDPR